MSRISPQRVCHLYAPVPRYPSPVYPQGRNNQGCPDYILPWGTQNYPFARMTCTHAPQPPSDTIQHRCRHPQPGPASDLTACQLHKPSSSLPQGVAGASAHSLKKPAEDALQKRELRLMKNREAARECRRKKKEYVRCLENRVAVLEHQNKTLIEELRALKDIYRHKVE